MKKEQRSFPKEDNVDSDENVSMWNHVASHKLGRTLRVLVVAAGPA